MASTNIFKTNKSYSTFPMCLEPPIANKRNWYWDNVIVREVVLPIKLSLTLLINLKGREKVVYFEEPILATLKFDN